ncbi:MAG: type I DNA topoisomerase [Chloroflexota bacterium]
MSKNLVIVESPAKAKTIEKFLGRRFTVKASLGHVRDLPRSQFGVDVDNSFSPKYITIRGKGEVLKELRDGAKKADKVFLATDPDREGEAIAWHLAHLLGIPDQERNRIEFHEITKEAIQSAIKRPRAINLSLVDAQQARRVLDRLVGYKLSPLLWRKVRRGLSAGRVQSAALKMIVDREREIEAFRPEEYWTIHARLETPDGKPLEARFHGIGEGKTEIPSQAAVDDILVRIAGKSYIVAGVKRRERRRQPAAPFTTSSLQQEASRKLGFGVRKTMSLAQQLYEGLELGAEGSVGLVTYIRTDSTRIAASAAADAAAYIKERYGSDYLPPAARAADVREGAQDAHEAIRPTAVGREPEAVKQYLNSEQYRLYRLIWERFLASQMADAILDTVSLDIHAGDATFRASGSTIRFAGFMAVYIESEDEGRRDRERYDDQEQEGLLPEVNEGDQLSLTDIVPKQHFTQPPPRYTEAALVRALEENGIGRPSTYAPIVETILYRNYAEREGRALRPTELGTLVVDLLSDYFPRVVDPAFTARLEDELDAVEAGDADWHSVVAGFYGPFAEDVAHAEAEIGQVEVPEEETDVTCDKCGRRMVIKYGRFGKFLACPGFPECRNTKPYFEPTGVKCPKCGSGDVVERRTKKGRRFYGCSRYPDCDFTTWQKPVNRECPNCGAFLVERRSKTEGLYYECVRDGCDYREFPTDGED